MRLIMCCQELPGRDYLNELRFSFIAAAFWKVAYPEGEVYLATNDTAKVPAGYNKHVKTMRFPFDRLPPAAARANFLAAYAESLLFDQDTVFTGHDVLVLKPFPEVDAKVVTNYRCHPSQPYCSDLLIAKVAHKGYAAALLKEMFTSHCWMPKPILSGAADQLSWALTLGMPDHYTGDTLRCPRKPDVAALPVDEYLYTANDLFYATGMRDQSSTVPVMFAEMATKTALHFKGNRKADFFRYAKWANVPVPTDFLPHDQLFSEST